MAKEMNHLFLKIFLVVLFGTFLDLCYLLYLGMGYSKGLTGFSIKTSVYGTFASLPPGSKTVLIFQWIFSLVIISFIIFRDVKSLKTKIPEINIEIKKSPNKNSTDLDSLYEALKERKELSILSISKGFNINKDIALDWCKILEAGELVSIEYPAFGQPIIHLKEKKVSNLGFKKSGIIDIPKPTPLIEPEIIDSPTIKTETEEPVNPSISEKEILNKEEEKHTLIESKKQIAKPVKKEYYGRYTNNKVRALEDEKKMIQEKISKLNAFGKPKTGF
jgi:hypothetical protein